MNMSKKSISKKYAIRQTAKLTSENIITIKDTLV